MLTSAWELLSGLAQASGMGGGKNTREIHRIDEAVLAQGTCPDCPTSGL